MRRGRCPCRACVLLRISCVLRQPLTVAGNECTFDIYFLVFLSLVLWLGARPLWPALHLPCVIQDRTYFVHALCLCLGEFLFRAKVFIARSGCSFTLTRYRAFECASTEGNGHCRLSIIPAADYSKGLNAAWRSMR